jgi:peptide/nickel transport system permease protein
MPRRAFAGLALIALVTLGAVLGPALDRHPAVGKDVGHGTTDLGAPLPPSPEWPLGTDMLGRCVAPRLGAGASVSLAVGVLAALVAVLVGTAVGLTAGWAGRAVDAALMRLVDVLLAFPFLLLVLGATALLRARGVGLGTVFLLLGLVGWTPVARVVRARVLVLRHADFVLAARATGAGAARILVRHVLPNIVGPAIALGTVLVAQMILVESTLSYLGLGAPPPARPGGGCLARGRPTCAARPGS